MQKAKKCTPKQIIYDDEGFMEVLVNFTEASRGVSTKVLFFYAHSFATPYQVRVRVRVESGQKHGKKNHLWLKRLLMIKKEAINM